MVWIPLVELKSQRFLFTFFCLKYRFHILDLQELIRWSWLIFRLAFFKVSVFEILNFAKAIPRMSFLVFVLIQVELSGGSRVKNNGF